MSRAESTVFGCHRDAKEMLDDAFPTSRIAVLEGQGHFAMNTAR